MMIAVRDTVTVFVRQALPTLRTPASLVFGMMQPLVFLVFFGPLLGGLTGLPVDSSWQWFVPSVLMMLALFGTTATGYDLLTEMQTGSYERVMVTPLSRASILAGRTLHDVAILWTQAVIVVAVTLPFGFRLKPGGALLGLLLLGVLGLAVGALSHALAVACRNNSDIFYGVQQTLLFPLLFLSGLMLPLEVGPVWMRIASRFNPLTYVVEAIRAHFEGAFVLAVVGPGWVAALTLAVVGLAIATRVLRRTAD
ncbi:MAG TPA: ABC transporter permease [Acidimicrobiia bacterium]|nr:ABC transporter permease [Acidimicrobiia bacterium]